MNETDQSRTGELREQVRTFVRRFGLLQEHRTPCGEPLGVPHAHALMYLLEAERRDEGGLRISELGAHLNVDKSNVSRLCARMEEEGHVERRPSPEDGRVKRLWLTEEGREVAVTVDDASLERFSRLEEAIGESDVDDVIDSVATLNRALASAFDEEGTT